MVLSKNELEIMDVLWSAETALTRKEIVDLSPERSWKGSSSYQMLNSLMEKNAVKVVGMKPSGKVFARTYSADITREACMASQMQSTAHSDKIRLSGVFAALVGDTEISEETLNELQKILDDLKGGIKKK